MRLVSLMINTPTLNETNKIINRYKLLLVTKTKIKKNNNRIKKKNTTKLLHLTKHVLLQDCDQIALLFPNMRRASSK